MEFTTGIVALLAATSVLLLGFGANLLFLTWHAAITTSSEMLRPPSTTIESYFSTRNVANSRNMCSLKSPRFSSASGGPTR